jgi:hypothetical protein
MICVEWQRFHRNADGARAAREIGMREFSRAVEVRDACGELVRELRQQASEASLSSAG